MFKLILVRGNTRIIFQSLHFLFFRAFIILICAHILLRIIRNFSRFRQFKLIEFLSVFFGRFRAIFFHFWQGRRLCRAGPHRGPHRAHGRQLHRHHGAATARDGPPAAPGTRAIASLKPRDATALTRHARTRHRARIDCAHGYTRHLHQLGTAGNACGRG